MSGDTGAINLRWARALLDGLSAAGMARVVISPGSRSTPLTLAALRHPQLDTRVIVDERAAAFYALGLAKAGGTPVGLIATSGSAPANWFPAVVEADMARLPLLLLSADRPPELQDCGANQTMDQLGMFGRHARAFHQLPPAETDCAWLAGLAARALAASLDPLPGPVHLNIPLREPLLPEELSDSGGTDPKYMDSKSIGPGPGEPGGSATVPRRLRTWREADPASLAELQQLLGRGPGALVCGTDRLGEAARGAIVSLAQRLGAPLFADILSNLRVGAALPENVLAHPDQVARSAPSPAWLLRLGGAPVSRAINAWLERHRGVPQLVVAGHPRLADPTASASHVIQADPALLCEALQGRPAAASWLAHFTAADRAAQAAADSLCADETPFEGALLRALLHGLPSHTPVLLGNSLTVRAADWFAGRPPPALRLFGNRGLSGIDGNLATACGIAGALGHAVAVLGDLALLHDLNSLALGEDCRLVLLLLDNGGGAIFDHLSQSSLPEFEQAWLTPRPFDPLLAAQAFGVPGRRVDSVSGALDAVLDGLDRPGIQLVHVPIDRARSLERIRTFHSASQQETDK